MAGRESCQQEEVLAPGLLLCAVASAVFMSFPRSRIRICHLLDVRGIPSNNRPAARAPTHRDCEKRAQHRLRHVLLGVNILPTLLLQHGSLIVSFSTERPVETTVRYAHVERIQTSN